MTAHFSNACFSNHCATALLRILALATPIPLNKADTPSRNENTTSKLTEERKEFLRNKAKSSVEARKVKLDDLIK